MRGEGRRNDSNIVCTYEKKKLKRKELHNIKKKKCQFINWETEGSLIFLLSIFRNIFYLIICNYNGLFVFLSNKIRYKSF
jgi:hypothetical protein